MKQAGAGTAIDMVGNVAQVGMVGRLAALGGLLRKGLAVGVGTGVDLAAEAGQTVAEQKIAEEHGVRDRMSMEELNLRLRGEAEVSLVTNAMLSFLGIGAGGARRMLGGEESQGRTHFSKVEGEGEGLKSGPESSRKDHSHEGIASAEEARRAVEVFNRVQAESGKRWRARIAGSKDAEGNRAESAGGRDVHRVGGPTAEQLAEEVARLFGRRIVVIETEGVDAPSFNGVVNSAPELSEYIFVHKNSSRPHLLTVSHEIWHHLHLSAPNLAALVKKELAGEVRNWSVLRSAKEGYPTDQHFDELMGDFLGDAFIEPSFWSRLENRNPVAVVFSRLASVVRPVLDRLLDRLRAAGFGSSAHIKDIERARNILADAVVKFQEKPFGDSKIGPYELLDSNESFYARASDQKYREIDRRWWKDFAAWRDGTIAKEKIFDFGEASDELLLAGFPSGSIQMKQRVLDVKPTQENHPFPVSILFNLPKRLRDPIMVFRSRTVADAGTILTEIEHEGKNVLVAVHFEPTPTGVELSSIKSIYPKDSASIFGWIADGLTAYYHKEKASNWLSHRTAGSNSPRAWVQLKGTKNVKTNGDLVK